MRKILLNELCDMTPVELDALVLSRPYRLKSFKSDMHADDMGALALELLEHESPGDLLSLIEEHRS